MEDDAPNFPRGGKSALSRQEEDEVRAEVDAEFEAEERELKKMRKTKQKNSYAMEEDLGSLFGGGGTTGKLPRFVNKITLKNVSPGMKLWGVICEVNQQDLVVTLSGGLRGLVRANEASDLFSENEDKVNVSPGMKLWGVICEVNQQDLVVTLPGGLRGLVRANEASDLFSENEDKVVHSV
ncbi:rRNA biogenesis protein RRP5-like [Telopea speciosissima]|uniref:rRNA biogenesis protein RRP5-like n=1 Tax=Telopea speciosissima TaxID=54955 RepID=UPI001CC79E8B|nr:rRNA biogenesis protein RRP5-like [Telopea speciosissima]